MLAATPIPASAPVDNPPLDCSDPGLDVAEVRPDELVLVLTSRIGADAGVKVFRSLMAHATVNGDRYPTTAQLLVSNTAEELAGRPETTV